MFLEPGLDFDHVQLSFLLDFYLTDAKLNVISFFFFFFPFCSKHRVTHTVQPLPLRSDVLFRARLIHLVLFDDISSSFQAQNDAAV